MYNHPVPECLFVSAIVFSIGYVVADSSGRNRTVVPGNEPNAHDPIVPTLSHRFGCPSTRAQTTATAIGGVVGAIQGASSAITECLSAIATPWASSPVRPGRFGWRRDRLCGRGRYRRID